MASFFKLNKLKLSTLLLIIFLYSNNYLFSQNVSEYKNLIKFSLSRTIDVLNPGFELNYEREYGKKFSTQVSATYLVDCFHMTPYKDYSGYRIMLEEKLFCFKLKPFRQYFSLETGYYSASMINSAYFVPKGIEWADELYDESQYEDIFNLKRTAVIISPKCGLQYAIGHFTIDFSAGLGIAIQNITHTNRQNPDDEMVSPMHPNIYYMTENEGKHSIPNFSLAVKLGYAF